MERGYHDQDASGRRVISHEERTLAIMIFLAAGVVGLALYIANTRLHIRPEQLIEGSLYLTCFLVGIWVLVHYLSTYKQKWETSWPRRAAFIPQHRDRVCVARAFQQNAVVLGYERRTPCFWSDDVRRMQSILLGSSGSGKTTVLRSIMVQDMERTSGKGHRVPLIFFDGKGDGAFLKSVLFDIAAAGRLGDLRVLNPSQPEISARYNPLYLRPGDSYHERSALAFESFDLKDDFFKSHQANYFNDLVRVLAHTGKQMNIYDVLVMALDEQVLREQISEASYRIERLSGINTQAKLNFSMSAKNLLQSLQDRDRVSKIQGLINELMIFVEDELSLVTCSYDNLLRLEDVIDRELILFISLNVNRNPRAVTALGRMILQDLQLMLGKRYGSGRDFVEDGSPLVSVILDEFAPFSYPNFAQILQQARGSNIALLFSLQTVSQLERVSRGFRHDVTSAANTIMLMKVSDQSTADYFQQAVSEKSSERLSERVERRSFLSQRYDRIGIGTSTPVKEPLVPDEHIKRLPRGQIHVLMSDGDMGAPRYFHMHGRRAPAIRPAFLESSIYPPIEPARSRVHSAHLRFKDAGLLRRFGRISGRKNQDSGA